MKDGRCNDCYYVNMKIMKKQWFGTDVKFAAAIFDSYRAKYILKQSNIPKMNENSAWASSGEDSDAESLSSVDSNPEHLEYFEEYFPSPAMVEPATLEDFQERP